MDNIFLLKLLFSFLVGSIWISSSTTLAEKFGPKIGGALVGIPATTVIALFFIGLTQSPNVASRAISIIPFILGIDAFFAVIYVYLLRYNFLAAISGSLLVWFFLSTILVLFKFDNFTLASLFILSSIILSYFFLERVLKTKMTKIIMYKFSLGDILLRGLVGGTVVAITILITKFGGALWGGVFTAFPALNIATMIITYKAQGKAFSQAVTKISMLSGVVNVYVYASAVRYLYPVLGLISGTLVSFMISLTSAYLVYLFVKSRA